MASMVDRNNVSRHDAKSLLCVKIWRIVSLTYRMNHKQKNSGKGTKNKNRHSLEQPVRVIVGTDCWTELTVVLRTIIYRLDNSLTNSQIVWQANGHWYETEIWWHYSGRVSLPTRNVRVQIYTHPETSKAQLLWNWGLYRAWNENRE